MNRPHSSSDYYRNFTTEEIAFDQACWDVTDTLQAHDGLLSQVAQDALAKLSMKPTRQCGDNNMNGVA